MQKEIEGVLNAGIALFRAGEGGVSSAISQVKDSFEELKKKGAADKSEASVKLRSAVEDISDRVDELANKAGSAYKDGVSQLEGQYNTVVEQIKQVIPSDKVNQLKDKISSLREAIKEKVSK